MLRRTNVLIGPHGADMTNAFALHAGTSVVELLPPIRNGCPCTMYQRMFAAEPQVFHYTGRARPTKTTPPAPGREIYTERTRATLSYLFR